MKATLWLVLLRLLIAMPGIPCLAANTQVSIVVDAQPCPAATFGVNKLLGALHSAQISCEKVNAVDAAQGNIIVFAGLSGVQGRPLRSLQGKLRRSRSCLNRC